MTDATDDAPDVNPDERSADPVSDPPESGDPPAPSEPVSTLTANGFVPGDRWAATGAIHPVQALKVAVFRPTDDPELFELNDVEIFRTGTWNGEQYNGTDLDEMVRNFDRVGFRPPVKLGHRETSGAPAMGWVRAIRRVGDRLVADFMDLPQQVYSLIKRRGFDAVSAEIFFGIRRNGQLFKRALKAVALLGTETPAVAGLKPLRENFSADELRLVRICAAGDWVQTEVNAMPDDDTTTQAELEAVRAELEALKAEKAALEANKTAQHTEESDAAVKMRAMREEIEALKRANHEAQERTRHEQMQSKCAALKTPAFRDHFYSLYDLATRARAHEDFRVVKFATEDDDGHKIPRDTDPVAVVDDLVARLNKVANGVFLREHTTIGDSRAALDESGGFDTGQDPGVLLDEQARAYMTQHNVDDYEAAFRAVTSKPSNRELVHAYATRSGGRVM